MDIEFIPDPDYSKLIEDEIIKNNTPFDQVLDLVSDSIIYLYRGIINYILYIPLSYDNRIKDIVLNKKINGSAEFKLINGKEIIIDNLCLIVDKIYKYSYINKELIIHLMENYLYHQSVTDIINNLLNSKQHLSNDIIVKMLELNIDVPSRTLRSFITTCKDINIIKKYNILNKITLDKELIHTIINKNNIPVLRYLYEDGFNVNYNIKDIKCNYETLLVLNQYDNIINVNLLESLCNDDPLYINELIIDNNPLLFKLGHVLCNVYAKNLTFDIINNLNINLVYIEDMEDLKNKYNEILCLYDKGIRISMYHNLLYSIVNNCMFEYFKFINKSLYLNDIQTVKSLYKISIYIKENNIYEKYLMQYIYIKDLNNYTIDELVFYYREILNNIKFESGYIRIKFKNKLVEVFDILGMSHLYKI